MSERLTGIQTSLFANVTRRRIDTSSTSREIVQLMERFESACWNAVQEYSALERGAERGGDARFRHNAKDLFDATWITLEPLLAQLPTNGRVIDAVNFKRTYDRAVGARGYFEVIGYRELFGLLSPLCQEAAAAMDETGCPSRDARNAPRFRHALLRTVDNLQKARWITSRLHLQWRSDLLGATSSQSETKNTVKKHRGTSFDLALGLAATVEDKQNSFRDFSAHAGRKRPK